MGKKDKSKFRRRLRAQILQEMAKVQKETPLAAESIISKNDLQSQSKIPTNTKTSEPTIIQTTPGVASQKVSDTLSLQLVRTDLKKSAIIIGTIILLIIVLFFIDQKTGFLLKASNEIFKVLHIGA